MQDLPPPQTTRTAATRVVLLGASNLAMYLPRVLSMARGALAGPLEIHAAAGLGRSYGQWSRVLQRELPGIATCELWESLEREHAERPLPTVAALVDVGNDLVYAVDAERIAGWVEGCVERLATVGASTTLVLLPMPSIEALGPWRFRLIRGVLFPMHPVRLEHIRDGAHRLQERLREIAAGGGATAVEQESSWYGFDPIHIRPRRAGSAWAKLLAGWGGSSEAAAGLSRAERSRVRSGRAALRKVRGRTVRGAQPAAVLADGSTLALY